MDEALIDLLLASPSVTALSGEGAASRIYWDTIGQGKSGTAAVLHKISGIPDYSHRGPGGLLQSRVQIDCRAKTRAAALALARAIEEVLSGYRGKVSGIRFGSILKVGERSTFEKTEAEAFYIVSADFMIWSGPAG